MFKEGVLLTKHDCYKVLNLVPDESLFQPSPLYWTGTHQSNKKTQNTKKTKDYYVNGNDVYNLLSEKLKKHLGITGFPKDDCVIIKYEPGSYFKKHRDGDSNSKRTLTVMIQLSAKSDYEGGELVTYTNNIPSMSSKKIGNVIIIDSTKLHEVLEITSGVRYSLVVWLHSENILTNRYI